MMSIKNSHLGEKKQWLTVTNYCYLNLVLVGTTTAEARAVLETPATGQQNPRMAGPPRRDTTHIHNLLTTLTNNHNPSITTTMVSKCKSYSI